MGSFDIREALTGRNYVTSKVPFWLEDKIFYQIAEVQEKHTRSIDNDEVARLDAELDRLEKERDEQAYTLFLTSISNRANEDIISKALAEWPIKKDVYGREDENNQIARGRLIREMQFAAHMTKIVDPNGVAQVVDDENRREIARALIDNAPPVSLSVIEQAIVELNQKFQVQQAEQQSPDFLSKH